MLSSDEETKKAVNDVKYLTPQGTGEMEIKLFTLTYLLGPAAQKAINADEQKRDKLLNCIKLYTARSYPQQHTVIRSAMEDEYSIETLTRLVTEPGAIPTYLTEQGIDIHFNPPALIEIPKLSKPQTTQANTTNPTNNINSITIKPSKMMTLKHKDVKAL